jgi:hypothetical protein
VREEIRTCYLSSVCISRAGIFFEYHKYLTQDSRYDIRLIMTLRAQESLNRLMTKFEKEKGNLTALFGLPHNKLRVEAQKDEDYYCLRIYFGKIDQWHKKLDKTIRVNLYMYLRKVLNQPAKLLFMFQCKEKGDLISLEDGSLANTMRAGNVHEQSRAFPSILPTNQLVALAKYYSFENDGREI